MIIFIAITDQVKNTNRSHSRAGLRYTLNFKILHAT